MKQNNESQVAQDMTNVPSEKRRIRWSTPPAASNAHRPSLTLISRGKARQKPLGPSWVGLIR